MNPKTRIILRKYLVYTLIMMGLFVLQTTPGLFRIFDIKPDFVTAAAVCIGFLEGELAGGIYGAAAGLMCDFTSTQLFGFHSMMLLILCTLVGLLFLYYFRTTLQNYVLVTLGVMVVRGLFDFLLHYLMWNYDGVEIQLLRRILPTAVYSAAFSPLIYFIYRKLVYQRYREVLEE